jgi:prepilin-type N-terminal cleavage/methylation domain-containing protein
MHPKNLKSLSSGFSLIELLAVMAIIAILVTVLIPVMMNSADDVKRGATDTFLSQLDSVISEFELEHGGAPLSSFDAKMTGVANNKVNEGSEMLVLKLYAKDRTAPELPDSRIGNVDGDTAKKTQTSFTNADLFEIVDDWGNPIVYIHRTDYGKTFTYAVIEPGTGAFIECNVKAGTNPATGDPYRKSSYQLISAGVDGIFGPNPDLGDAVDDITNY